MPQTKSSTDEEISKEQSIGQSEQVIPVEKKEEVAPSLLALPEQFNPAFHFLQIDFTNRAVKVIPGVNRATSTRHFLKLSQDFFLSGVLEADATVTTVNGTQAEITLNSYTIPLNSLSRNYIGAASASGPKDYRKAGNVLRVWGAGVYTTDDATATVAIRLKVGSTTYHTITTTAATVTNVPWHASWYVIIPSIGATGTAESYALAQTNNVNKHSGSTATVTINTTAAQVVSLTAQWSAGSAGDTISIRQFLVELLN